MTDTTGFICDLSHYQTSIDFAEMKAGGIAAVILKASEGTSFTDHTFAQRAASARAAGLLVGAYHFFDSSVDPIAQAHYFLGIASAAGVKVLAVDFEPPTAGAGEDSAAALCQALHDRTGRWPLLYTGKWNITPEALPKLAASWRAYVQLPTGRSAVAPTDAALLSCPLWLAEWTTAASPNLPPGFASWELWQFESVLNAVSGVSGECSRTRINGTLADLQAWWGGAPPPTDTVLDTIVDSSGRTHQIIDRVVAASSAVISGATVSMFLALALLGCNPAHAPIVQQVAKSFDWSGTTFYLDRDLRPVPIRE